MNFQNLTKLADCGFSLYIESHRYGGHILAGIDFPLQSLENYTYFGRESVFDYIDISNTPGDLDAMEAYTKLCDFAQENEAFLFASEDSLEKCLIELDRRAALWLDLDEYSQNDLLNRFIKHKKNE